MALFEVPGWSVPSAPVTDPSAKTRKRKRHEHDDGAEVKVQSAAMNLQKLVASLGSIAPTGKADKESPSKKSKKAKGKEVARDEPQRRDNAKKDAEDGKARGGKGQKQANERGKKGPHVRGRDGVKQDTQSAAGPHSPEKPVKKQKNKKKGKSGESKAEDESIPEVTKASWAPKQDEKKSSGAGLTALQATMKHSLDGARFRWINETLYKSDSAEAHDLMRENPSVFSEYHTGFRHQVQAWPENPVSHYISTLSSLPSKTVIADLGCGDAALARTLVPKGLIVLSFDLVSDNSFVIEADTCSRIPLPGSEDADDDDSQVVDVVVCALSLMSTNWVGCIREAWRILKSGGELKIAEVASRFTDVEEFTSLVTSAGFKLRSTDDKNSHFTLFEFTKAPRKLKGDKEWKKLMERGSVLKPCEYKRR